MSNFNDFLSEKNGLPKSGKKKRTPEEHKAYLEKKAENAKSNKVDKEKQAKKYKKDIAKLKKLLHKTPIKIWEESEFGDISVSISGYDAAKSRRLAISLAYFYLSSDIEWNYAYNPTASYEHTISCLDPNTSNRALSVTMAICGINIYVYVSYGTVSVSVGIREDLVNLVKGMNLKINDSMEQSMIEALNKTCKQRLSNLNSIKLSIYGPDKPPTEKTHGRLIDV